MITSKRLMSILAVFAFLLLFSTTVRAEQPDIVDKVATAETAAEHAEIAEYYERRAAEGRAEAERHRNMAKSYKRASQRLTGRPNLAEHCTKVAERLEANAKVHDIMAELHRQQAEESE